MKIDIVDLEENLQYLDQYIELRNSFTDKLLCEKVTMQDTKEWIKNTQLCIKIATQNSLILGVVILYMDKENEITVFVKEQNKGLGNLLLLEIEKFALDSKIKQIYAWIQNTNIASQSLFLKQKYIKQKQSTKIFNNIKYTGDIYQKELSI